MKPKEGLGMKILKSILNYLTSSLIFVISTIGLLINWKRKKPAMKN